MLILFVLFLAGCVMGEPPLATPNPEFAINLNQPQIGEQPPQDMPAAPIAPVHGGKLRIAMPMPMTLNPLLNSDPDVDTALRLIFEPLVVFDADKRPRPNPAITQSIAFSPDGSSLNIALYDDIFWEDGSPITSADIAFSIDVLRFSAPETALHRPKVENIASHAVLDGRTLQVNLHSPMWAMKYMLNFPIIPMSYYQGVSMTNLTAARNMHPLGNGPFRFLSYEAAVSLELIANDFAAGGAPYISRVSAMILRDIGGARYAFEQGLIDVLAATPYDWGRYSAMGKNRSAEVLTGHFDFIGFNAQSPLFASHEARQAVAYSLDLQMVLQRYYAQADAAIAPINPESWLAAYDLPQPTHDPARAMLFFRHLDSASQITIIVNAANPEGIGAASFLADGMEYAGANVNLEILPFADFSSRVANADFDIVVGGISLSPAPNFGFLGSLLGYSSENLGFGLTMMRYAVSESGLMQATAVAQQYVADNLPVIGIAFRRQVLYTAGHVHGRVEISINDIFANVNDWFIHNIY